MKRVFLLMSCYCALVSVAVYGQQKKLPRIAVAGLGIESSTFSPALTNEEAFHARYASEVFNAYPFFGVDAPLRSRAVWVPAIVGKSLPGGAVTREAYESLVNKTLDSLKKTCALRRIILRYSWGDERSRAGGSGGRLYYQDPEGDRYENDYFDFDGPAWQCVLATGSKYGPDYLLPDGPTRGCHGNKRKSRT